jgi:NDP-sugar pyrophosphorylase family protein
MLAAIVMVESEARDISCGLPPTLPLACVDVLGQSVLGRLVTGLHRQGIEAPTVLADDLLAAFGADFARSAERLPLRWEGHTLQAAQKTLSSLRDKNVEFVVLMRANAYAELEIEDLVEFHRTQDRPVTRTFDAHGPLDVWIVTTQRVLDDVDLSQQLLSASSRYIVRGYVNRLQCPQDLRRLVKDSLAARCQLRPDGAQMRPGVWVGEGASVHRKARIVAPAFLGRCSKVNANCLITRGSNVESSSEIDFDTVVEDSSVLANSYVGIGLDVTHSVVDGSTLHSLKHHATLHIADPALIGRTAARGKGLLQSSPLTLGLAQHSICARHQRRSFDSRLKTRHSLFL